MRSFLSFSFFFFFNDTATTEIYTLSLHDALPISMVGFRKDGTDYEGPVYVSTPVFDGAREHEILEDRKSTRLNSSHLGISYAVFCLKKKKKKKKKQNKTITTTKKNQQCNQS